MKITETTIRYWLGQFAVFSYATGDSALSLLEQAGENEDITTELADMLKPIIMSDAFEQTISNLTYTVGASIREYQSTK